MCYRPANTVTIVKCLECGADLNESRKAADEAAAPSPGAPKEISLKPQGLDGAPKAPGAPAAPKAPGAPKPPAN